MSGYTVVVITWFDALLVTILAGVTALGVRRGLIGGIWGGVGVLAALISNLLIPNSVLATLLTLIVTLAVSVLSVRTIPNPVGEIWHLFVGGLGGFLLGAVLLGTLALGFPMRVIGATARYPSDALAPALYDGVANSYIQQRLSAVVWSGDQAGRTLLVPDYMRRR